MTKEENIATLNEHLDHWKRLLSEKICDQDEGEKTIDALHNAIKVLEQDPCDDCVSRQAVLDEMYKRKADGDAITAGFIKNLPSVTPAEKVGRWILVQRGKYVDVNCSECGFSRIREFAYNYTVEDISEQELRDFVEKNKMNFCECCGAKMEEF